MRELRLLELRRGRAGEVALEECELGHCPTELCLTYDERWKGKRTQRDAQGENTDG